MLQEKSERRREEGPGGREINAEKRCGSTALIVSACLAGVKCSYDGRDRFNKKLMSRLFNFRVIPICPEMMGGMTCPREPNEISGGDGNDVLSGRAKVLSVSGKDNTGPFVSGAEKVFDIAVSEGYIS